MRTVRVYSSAPETTQLAVAFQCLKLQGIAVEVVPTTHYQPPAVVLARQQLQDVCVLLAGIGEQLDQHEAGTQRLGAGEENGLRAKRDSLLSRKRGLQASLRALKGGSTSG